MWDIWWARKVFTEPGLSLAYTKDIFWPQGTTLLFHAYSFYNIFLGVLMKDIAAPALTYNLLVLSTFPLSGIAAFLLVKYITRNSYLAALGGFIFAFNPTHYLRSLHHIEIASIQFLPLFVLFYIKAIREGTKKNLVLAVIFFFLCACCSWYYFFFNIYFLVFAYVYLALRRRKIVLRDVLWKSAVMLAVTLLVFSPWIIKMILLKMRVNFPLGGGFNTSIVDPLALFVPHPRHWFGLNRHIWMINDRLVGSYFERSAYLGLINLFFIAACFKATIKKNARYFLGIIMFLLLSMGANLHFFGQITPVVLPYTIIKHLPFLSSARSPSRAIAYVYLFLAIMVPVAVKSMSDRFTKRSVKIVFVTVVMFLIVADFGFWCRAKSLATFAPCYDIIMNDHDDFAVLDVPWNYYLNGKYMMYQTYHGKPIVQGAISRQVEPTLASGLRLATLEKDGKLLKDNRIKYIVIHWKAFFEYLSPKTKKKLYTRIVNMRKERVTALVNAYEVVYHDEEHIVVKVYTEDEV